MTLTDEDKKWIRKEIQYGVAMCIFFVLYVIGLFAVFGR